MDTLVREIKVVLEGSREVLQRNEKEKINLAYRIVSLPSFRQVKECLRLIIEQNLQYELGQFIIDRMYFSDFSSYYELRHIEQAKRAMRLPRDQALLSLNCEATESELQC